MTAEAEFFQHQPVQLGRTRALLHSMKRRCAVAPKMIAANT
ncbi:hypothetical protein BQ8420_01910 [Nocardiopsis sp. JB363]|nr:hypothetical protein BQ8420_01910 [Nocardiopsis sp. JB363]